MGQNLVADFQRADFFMKRLTRISPAVLAPVAAGEFAAIREIRVAVFAFLCGKWISCGSCRSWLKNLCGFALIEFVLIRVHPWLKSFQYNHFPILPSASSVTP